MSARRKAELSSFARPSRRTRAEGFAGSGPNRLLARAGAVAGTVAISTLSIWPLSHSDWINGAWSPRVGPRSSHTTERHPTCRHE